MLEVGGMDGFVIHASFDVLAWLAAGAAALWLSRTGRVSFPVPQPLRLTYLAALVFGAGVGAVAFGSANLWLSGLPGIARSIEGAVAGAIVAIEIYKRIAGITLRTGARFALPFAVGVAVGRIGCFFSGLDDFTHGTPTSLPWAHDFGDGVPRHPVQLYESAAMAAFAAVYVWRVLARRPVLDRRNGFYLAVGCYGAAALRLGIPQAVRHADRPVHAVSSPVRRRAALCDRDDRDGAEIRECP